MFASFELSGMFSSNKVLHLGSCWDNESLYDEYLIWTLESVQVTMGKNQLSSRISILRSLCYATFDCGMKRNVMEIWINLKKNQNGPVNVRSLGRRCFNEYLMFYHLRYSPLKPCVIQTNIRLIHVRQGLGGIVMLFNVSKCAL